MKKWADSNYILDLNRNKLIASVNPTIMSLPQIVIGSFIVLELTNVISLYFKPETKKSNSIGVFKAWEKSKIDPDIGHFVEYLVNWIEGTKLIFIFLLVVILITANQVTLNLTLIALILSITTFFWRLFPLIRKMDKNDMISPKNYSTTLVLMILTIIIAMLITLSLSLLIG
ncbi:MAG: hypothetical protein ACFE95_11155 [Candidatus Hodarchaeota archaeon]